MANEHKYRGCRITREHGPRGWTWCARAPMDGMKLVMAPTLRAAKAELDVLWGKGVRWFLGERYVSEACESCGSFPRLCDWCDEEARHFINVKTKPGEPSHACEDCVHFLLRIPRSEWDAHREEYEAQLGAYSPNSDCNECISRI